jgi:hypothetical protein
VSFAASLRGLTLVDRAARPLKWVRETWKAARSVRKERGTSTLGVLSEQARLFRQYDLDQYAYYWYRLFEKHIPLEEKIHYLPDSVAANARLWSLLTPDSYRCLYHNKLVFNRFFGSLGFPLAEIYGVYDPHVGYTAGGDPLRTSEDLRRCLLRHADHGFVFKPAEGIQGHHILIFTGRAPGEAGEALVTLSGDCYDAARLADFAREPQLYPSTILERTRSLFCWNNGSFRTRGWPSSGGRPSARYEYKRSSLEMDIRRSLPQSSSCSLAPWESIN